MGLGFLAVFTSAPNNAQAQGGSSFEAKTNRPGTDYRTFELDAADARICRDTCIAEQGCKAWTYVNPGIQGPKAKCWLKNSVPPAKPANCCISGVKDASGGGSGTGRFKTRWDQIGGSWTTGWVYSDTQACGHGEPHCQACPGQSACGSYRNGQIITVTPFGVRGNCNTKWKLRCTAVP